MIFRRSKIYLDYAAGAPVLPSVLKVITEANNLFANPSSYSSLGTEARKKINEARDLVASFLGSFSDEIIFTASGSESNSLAILGLDLKRGDVVVTTPIEHSSVLSCMNVLKERGVEVEYLSVNSEGIVSLEDLKLKLSLNPKLISIMYANNEIGSIQPLLEIGKIISQQKDNKPLLHVDACQATGYLPMNVRRINADLVSFNGSKIGGPRGSGVLFIKRGVGIKPFIVGGDQEFGLRAGTENTASILGLAEAIKNIKPSHVNEISKLRDIGFDLIQDLIPEAIINGPIGDLRLPNNINISLPGINGDSLLAMMDNHGVVVGTGSACTSKSVDASHVLKAISVPEEYIMGSIRISFGQGIRESDIVKSIKVLDRSYRELLSLNK